MAFLNKERNLNRFDLLEKYKKEYFMFLDKIKQEKLKFNEKNLNLKYLEDLGECFDELKLKITLYELEENDKELKNLQEKIKKNVEMLEEAFVEAEDIFFVKAITILKDVETLLNIDKIRCNMDSYGREILQNGHWDIYEFPDKEIEEIGNLNKRNPQLDIEENSIVAIDFGTKSTVVVVQNNNGKIIPMRIGGNNLRKTLNEKQYENPTIIEFIDIESFLSDYKLRDGRPETKWKDVTVSYSAYNSFIDSRVDDYKAFFSNLKQWAAEEKKRLQISDKKGKKINLNIYRELEEKDIDIIEIYAYYIGCYVNNMNRGIYLNYIMSFPTTYDEEIKEKLTRSFEKGLKKSLPNSIVKNDEIISKLKVTDGGTEPSGYAITALQAYEFMPKNNEKIFYGIMDLGGGTVDFDFGLWREADLKSEKRYDYILEQYGSDGDRELGGENLLELITYEVFKRNSNEIRKADITFKRPILGKNFSGDEGVVSDSEVARINMIILREKLRPIIEKPAGYEKIFEKGTIGVNLYCEDRENELVPNVQLIIEMDKLNEIIEEKIQSVVNSFFKALEETFVNENFKEDINKINIFLAGNFSKSKDLKKILKDKIQEVEANLRQSLGSEFAFELYPALGTKEAYEIFEKNNIKIDEEKKALTGKTGVAYGMIESRYEGRIRVINKELTSDGKQRFRYYVGENRRKVFKHKLGKRTPYNKWIELIDASVEEFEIYYTHATEAATDKLSIDSTKKKKLKLDKAYSEEVLVYIRSVEPEIIEYVVATEEGIELEEYLYGPIQVELG